VVVDFEILRRRAGSDLPIVSWQESLTPGADVSEAIPLELTATGAAVAVEEGDQLVFRYSGESGDLPMAYVPNGEGANTGGRIPFIDLPQ
jgi:hypothetical protein